MGGVPAEDDAAEPKTHGRMLIDALAGAIAGCVSRFLTGPLDVIKIRFQVQLEPIVWKSSSQPLAHVSKYTGLAQAFLTIFKEEGIQGLWRGTVPGLLLTVPYTAVQFVALHQLRDSAAKLGLTAHPTTAPMVAFGTGALAGAAGTIASYPFDLLRTTLAAQGEPKVYHGMFDAARGIVRAQGFGGLYRGLNVTLIEIMPYAALQFGIYDVLHKAWKQAKIDRLEASASSHGSGDGSGGGSKEGPWYDSPQVANFVCGLAAGLFAKLATHPLDVAKKRYQVAGLQRSLRYGARIEATYALRSLATSLADIYTREGVAGLWKGSIPSIVKAAPSAALTFTAYEAALAWLVSIQASAHKQKRHKLDVQPLDGLLPEQQRSSNAQGKGGC